jgi:hypothetical protein
MLEVFNDIFATYYLPNISDINFSWFPPLVTAMGTTTNGQVFSENGIINIIMKSESTELHI